MIFEKGLQFIILLLILTGSSICSEITGSAGVPRKAVMFEINDILRVSSFNGRTISYKTLNDQGVEYRYSLTLDGRYSEPKVDTEAENYLSDLDSTISFNEIDEDKSEGSYIDVGFAKLWHKNNERDIQFFSGIGSSVFINVSHYLNDGDRRDYTGRTSRVETTSLNLGTGGELIAGAEWFVKDYMSLHIEYTPSIVVTYHWSERISDLVFDDGDTNYSKRVTKYTDIRFHNATLLGISLYF